MTNLSVRVINIEFPREANSLMESQLANRAYVQVDNIRMTCTKELDEILDMIQERIDPNGFNIITFPDNMRISSLHNGIYELIPGGSMINYFAEDVESGNISPFVQLVVDQIEFYEREELKKVEVTQNISKLH